MYIILLPGQSPSCVGTNTSFAIGNLDYLLSIANLSQLLVIEAKREDQAVEIRVAIRMAAVACGHRIVLLLHN
ncbi:MAG: hypothetical protein PUP93_06515 [Rhizonema sp. NSF051]|nr:hypothetical protein [Rhizonema sp. NSF051]